MPEIIHVDMDCFFAAVEIKDNPDLAGKPVIVGAMPGTRGVVAACSYEARKYGVHSAMPISQAVKKCPHAVFLTPNGKRYSEESKKIMAILRDFTPLVEQISIDEAFLDVSGSHRLFGTSAEIGRQIKKRIKDETGLIASVGIAPSKFVAKIASDIGKPDGFVIVGDDEVPGFLRPLDARKMWGVGKAAWKKLENAGIKTIGDIADTPINTLERMFGPKTGYHFLTLALGNDSRPVDTETERKQISAEYTFNEDTDDITEVERVLLALSDKVASRLFQKGEKGGKITLKLRDSSFETITRSKSVDIALSSGEDIFREAKALFTAENFTGKVRLIGVSISEFEKAGQTSLFDGESTKKNKVEEVLSNIRNRFGKTAITRAALIKKKDRNL